MVSIESTGGKELHDDALLNGDLAGSVFALGILACRDMAQLWDMIVEVAAKRQVLAAGDSACGFGNTAMIRLWPTLATFPRCGFDYASPLFPHRGEPWMSDRQASQGRHPWPGCSTGHPTHRWRCCTRLRHTCLPERETAMVGKLDH